MIEVSIPSKLAWHNVKYIKREVRSQLRRLRRPNWIVFKCDRKSALIGYPKSGMLDSMILSHLWDGYNFK